jgi:5'-phosphate synthase pdxT subunit
MGKDLKVLATYNNQPVMVTDGRHYVCSFHPEIGSDFRIHEYILKQVNA